MMGTAETADNKIVKQLSAAGMQCQGDIFVTVDEGGKVIEENAQDKPGMLSNRYAWHLSWHDVPARIIVQF